MLLSNLEYVALRLARRFLLSNIALDRYARYPPYYRANVATGAPDEVADSYATHLAEMKVSLAGTRVELGIGATNGSIYDLAAGGAIRVFGVERHVCFEPGATPS